MSAGQIDVLNDARTLSLSARQDFATAFGQYVTYGAWFTGEAIAAETQSGPSEFERRDVTEQNPDLLGLWTSLSVAREAAERVVASTDAKAKGPLQVDRARAALYAAYSYLVMAEHYCVGRADGGRLLTTDDMLDRAIDYFGRARQAALAGLRGTDATDSAEALSIATAALVGRARAYLQRGALAETDSDAAAVPAAFTLSLWYVNAPADLARLGNALWYHTVLRATLSIASPFRDLNDPRVPVAAPNPAFPPFDGITPLWTQRKYTSYDASIELASGMEARYLRAEALGTGAMLALVQERRMANSLAAYSGPTDSTSILREFLNQRGREFFLEGKRMSDTRRHPGLVIGVPAPGSAYHKPGYPPVRDQQCWPLPSKETGS